MIGVGTCFKCNRFEFIINRLYCERSVSVFVCVMSV